MVEKFRAFMVLEANTQRRIAGWAVVSAVIVI
jgi:hypothetical protein